MKNIFSLLSLSALCLTSGFAQNSDRQPNVVSTGVPYLLISPDSRGGSLGDQGAATLPDENSIFWNMSKSAFLEQKNGVSVSYAPWLTQLVNDVYITSIAGHHKLNDNSAVALNVKYFSLGEINFREFAEEQATVFSPNEFVVDAGYSLKLSRRLSAGIVLKYINSNLAQGAQVNNGQPYRPAQTVASDISAYYQGRTFDLSGRDAFMTYGMNISNIGGKVRYQEGDEGNFIPANFRLGSGVHIELDKYNKISFSVETTKLLVPTRQPGDDDANEEIRTLSSIEGVFRSLGDSPEGETELDEFSLSIGAEYWYNNVFAFRAGYFTESEFKGNRKYATFGVGGKLEQGSFDFSYLTAVQSTNHPLEGTLRFTLTLDLGAFSSPLEEAKEEEKKNEDSN